MFTDIATTVARSSYEQGLSSSRAAVRAQLSREYIQFFQYRIPEIIEQAIAIAGALVGMAIFDKRIAAACFVITVPLLLISRTYGRKVVGLQKEFHDNVEDTYDVFSSGNPERVRSYYSALALPQQKIANWGAAAFGLMRLVLLGVFLVVLYIAIDLDDFTTGNIYTIVAYIWTFVTSSEYLPELMESATSLKDISHRLRQEVETPPPEVPHFPGEA
jgi:ABC-type multidrug transport system fused ATPase/permease subunit